MWQVSPTRAATASHAKQRLGQPGPLGVAWAMRPAVTEQTHRLFIAEMPDEVRYVAGHDQITSVVIESRIAH